MKKVFLSLFLLFCFKGEACPQAFNKEESVYEHLQDKNLANKDVRNKHFQRKILIGVDLRGTDARGVDFRNSIFYDVKVDKNTKIEGAKFLYARVGAKEALYLKEYLESQGLEAKGPGKFSLNQIDELYARQGQKAPEKYFIILKKPVIPFPQPKPSSQFR